MAVDTTSPNYYLLGLTNYSSDGYAKNSTQRLGGYSSRIAYTWECLVAPSVSGIPSGSTVNSVTISINVVTDDDATAGGSPLRVHKQDKATWTDNGTQPQWNNPAGFTSGTWPTALSTLTGVDGTGTKTIPTSTALVDLFQDYVDGVEDEAYGLILTMYTDYFGYYITFNSVSISVDYTAPSGRRRIIIT